MNEKTKDELQQMADRICEVVNAIPRPLDSKDVTLRIVAELSWALGAEPNLVLTLTFPSPPSA